MAVERQIKELVLGTGQYAYVQDLTAGFIKVYTGPSVLNQTAQDRPIVYDPKKGWVPVEFLSEAVKSSPIAVEGYYLTLFNPPQLSESQNSIQEAQPKEGATGHKPPLLDVGKRVNIPGPVTFALWPGQHARWTKGHHLRSNQYLKVQVYNEAEAQKHWSKAVVQSSTGETTELKKPQSLTVGTTLLVTGTDVSFYIPPTGIKVLERQQEDYVDGDSNKDPYVRDALTLERLEYAILVDENGNKRYEKGPQVVFPEPTERFIFKKGDGDNNKVARKFRALELTLIQGIHLKVIAPYKDGDREYKEGEELFITGADTSIYYPREEHSLISYDGQAKHFATAIPAGEARYILNRLSGEISMVKGPKMCLPDPRKEVFVRRVLTDEQCALWYPNNEEARVYNEQLRNMLGRAPSTRAGVISDGDYARATRGGRTKSGGNNPAGEGAAINYAAASFTMADSSVLGNSRQSMIADEFTRGSTYTDPRTLTLNTKYQGVPTINLWPGYAITVIRPTGSRRVVTGPATVHLEYDETLEVLELSTGKPKSEARRLKTVYLKAQNNKISDIIQAETSDHVLLNLVLSYELNFEGEASRWFAVENYVKYFTDRLRSVLKGAIHKIGIIEFHASYTDIIRNIILGAKKEDSLKDERTGYTFPENGMRIKDVDVLTVDILDVQVRDMLNAQQARMIKSSVEITNVKVEHETATELEALKQLIAALRLDSIQKDIAHQRTELQARHEMELQKIAARKTQEEANQAVAEVSQDLQDFLHASELKRQKASEEQEIAHLQAQHELEKAGLEMETRATVETYAAIAPGLAEALQALSRDDVVVQVSKALSTQAVLGGTSISDTVSRIFRNTPIESVVQSALDRLPATTTKATPNGAAKQS